MLFVKNLLTKLSDNKIYKGHKKCLLYVFLKQSLFYNVSMSFKRHIFCNLKDILKYGSKYRFICNTFFREGLTLFQNKSTM